MTEQEILEGNKSVVEFIKWYKNRKELLVCPDCGSERIKSDDYHFPNGKRCEACYHVWKSDRR